MPKPPSFYVPHLYCHRGPKGDDPNPCSGVQNIRSLQAGGCFLGEIMPDKEAPHAKFIKTQEAKT